MLIRFERTNERGPVWISRRHVTCVKTALSDVTEISLEDGNQIFVLGDAEATARILDTAVDRVVEERALARLVAREETRRTVDAPGSPA